MEKLLKNGNYDFISEDDKKFIIEFDERMNLGGYSCNNTIGEGYCWGRYMIIYSKKGVKSKKVIARIYIRDKSIVLRLFLNDIDKHRSFIEAAPDFIKEAFVNDFGRCTHCHNEKEGTCRFRKSYIIDDEHIDKCNGITFEFWNPNVERLRDYINLLEEFYPHMRR